MVGEAGVEFWKGEMAKDHVEGGGEPDDVKQDGGCLGEHVGVRRRHACEGRGVGPVGDRR